MITFIICLTLLVGSYFTYAKYLERISGLKATDNMPCDTLSDGIDFIRLPRWKTFLIQLRNMKSDAAAFPIVPTIFITIACGAIPGFHATQSPLMAGAATILTLILFIRNDKTKA